MQIALRERNRDAVGVQGVVHHFRGAVGVGNALGGKDVLLHDDIDTTVAKLSKHHIDAFIRLHDFASVGVFFAHHLQGFNQDIARLLQIGAVGHTYMQLEELVGVALGEVGEALGKQRCVEEGNGDTVDGLHLGALVIDIGNRTAHAVALNPVANP